MIQIILMRKIFRKVYALSSWSSYVNIHVYLEVTLFSKRFLADITCVQLLFMASFNMFLQLVLSVERLCTNMTCEPSITVNLEMPCKVSFLEYLSTFITFPVLMQLIVVVV